MLNDFGVPQVSVIVVNYNGLRFLDGFFRSMAHAFSRHTHELIVVDNASTDGSLERLRQQPGIVLIESPVNTGFTGGNNLGAQRARGEVLLLLNNDTEWHEPLDALIDVAREIDVGAAGCQLRYGDGRLQHSVGLAHSVARIVLSWLGLEKRRWLPPVFRKFEVAPAVYAQPQPAVAWVSGACMATRRVVWDYLQGLNDELFMYCEDVDYGARASALGLRVAYTPTPVVTHFEGGGKSWVGVGALLRTCRAYVIVTRNRSGMGAARCMAFLLSLVFASRYLALHALALLPAVPERQALWLAKAHGFGRAAASLSHAAWRARVPDLP